MDELFERRPLLTAKGRLAVPGWGTGDVFDYNKERISAASRRREWEFYQVSNPRFAFQIAYGHGPSAGKVTVTLVDFETGEKVRSGKVRLFPKDELDLDFSGADPHSLKYEDDDLFLSIGFDGETRRIVARSDRFDAELICHEDGDAIAVAAPYGKRHFLYQYKRVFGDLSGHVHMHKLDYRLDDETFMILSSGRGLLPYQNARIWAAGAVQLGDELLALSLGEDFGPEGAPTENAVFLNGALEKINRVYFKFKAEDPKRPWRISDSDKRLRLEFFPEFDNFDRWNYLAADVRRHQLYGKLFGTVILPGEREYRLEDVHFFVEHSDERW